MLLPGVNVAYKINICLITEYICKHGFLFIIFANVVFVPSRAFMKNNMQNDAIKKLHQTFNSKFIFKIIDLFTHHGITD